jgi:hypothetical protein
LGFSFVKESKKLTGVSVISNKWLPEQPWDTEEEGSPLASSLQPSPTPRVSTYLERQLTIMLVFKLLMNQIRMEDLDNYLPKFFFPSKIWNSIKVH